MKIHFQAEMPVVKDNATIRPPIKVCMHVLGTARTDVRVMREAMTLVEKGYVVCVVDVECERNHPLEENICGIHMKHIIMPSWFSSTHSKLWAFIKAVQVRIRGILLLVQTSADIYHAHDVTALPASYITARLHHKSLIFDAHELPLPESDSPHWPWIGMLLGRFVTSVLPYCAGVITVSSPIAQEIYARYHVPRVTLIRNVPTYRVVPKSDRLRQYLGFPPDVQIALYQGNLQPDRGLDRLILAATHLERNIVIVLMGRGIGATQAELEDLIAREGVSDRVKIIPPVPYTELLDWTASADVGLIIYSPNQSLNHRMCLPNKLFEYLMSGLPVLASPLDAIVEVIKTYDAGKIVPSLAPADIAASINDMLSDITALTRMSHNALEAAQRDLCWEKESQQLTRLYNHVLKVG
jgi:glycosyltransferase involved in cell wall biosynthesis